MKIYITILSFLLLFIACKKEEIIVETPPEKDALVSKPWKISSLVFKLDAQEFNATIDANALGENANFNFLESGNYTYQDTDTKKTGSWKWLDKNKKLELTDANKLIYSLDVNAITSTEFSYMLQNIDLTKSLLSTDEDEILDYFITHLAISGKNWEVLKTGAKNLSIIIKMS